MKKISVLLIFLLTFSVSYSQRFEITPNHTTNIKPNYTRTPGKVFDTVHIHIKLTGAFDTAESANNTVTFQIQKFNLPNNPQLVNASMSFPEEVWPSHPDRDLPHLDTTIILSILMDKIKDSLTHDEAGHIVIAGTADKYHTLRLTNSLLSVNSDYNSTKPFWVEIGSNFDLVDKLQPNNFFAGVFFHRRDVRPIFYSDSNYILRRMTFLKAKKKEATGRYGRLARKNFRDPKFVRQENLGIFAGIFESQTITNNTEQNFSLRQYYDSSSFMPGIADSARIFTGVGNYSVKRVVSNLSLFFSPQVRLTNGSANKDGLHFFTSIWAELQWQKIEEDLVFSQIRKQDSVTVPINDIQQYDAPGNKRQTDIRSHYFGIGFPVYFRQGTDERDLVQLLINPVFGFSNQPTASYLNELSQAESKGIMTPLRQWKPFYIVQFRLNEEKYGVAFTGEVRGLLSNRNPPFVSLALTKKFDLTKFLEFGK